MNRLTLEKLIKAHTAYSKILDGLQMCQNGAEDLYVSGFFNAESTVAELIKIKKLIENLTQQSKDIAKTKGFLVKTIKDIDQHIDVFGPSNRF